jgi:hypothetical protein
MNTTSLYSIKEKAKAKLQTIQDKIDCNTEIAENNLGYELTRALAGLQANEEHLRVARENLKQCIKDEEELDTLLEETDTSLEEAKTLLKTTYDAKLAKLSATYKKELAELEQKHSGKFKKTVKKTSDRMTLLLQRVSKWEGSVTVSKDSVERLQNNKPKAIIRAEFEAKKPERDLAYVRTIEEMNAYQAKTRDAKSSVAVESYPENRDPVKPKRQVKKVPKPFVPRPMPPETADEKAYWGSVTGVHLDELASLKALALAEDEAHRKSVKA